MTRGFLISLVVHAAVLAAACFFVVGPPTRAPRAVLALHVHSDESAPVERPPPAPEPPDEECAPPEEWLHEDVPRDGEPLDETEFAVEETPRTAVEVRLPAYRLPKPLPHRVRAPPPVPAQPRAKPPPPVVRPRAPAGPTHGARLVREGARPLVYPREARRRGLEGRVLLRLRAGADGRVKEVRVVRSSGHAILDEAAVKAAWGWRFEPARKNGVPVESWYERAVRFRLAP